MLASWGDRTRKIQDEKRKRSLIIEREIAADKERNQKNRKDNRDALEVAYAQAVDKRQASRTSNQGKEEQLADKLLQRSTEQFAKSSRYSALAEEAEQLFLHSMTRGAQRDVAGGFERAKRAYDDKEQWRSLREQTVTTAHSRHDESLETQFRRDVIAAAHNRTETLRILQEKKQA